ncbi:MAG: NRAMP family divalent metal transporter [Candidatus Dormibacteria bacterium]
MQIDEEVRARARGGARTVRDDGRAGDIRGALGTIREHERSGRRSWRQRALALAAIMGPGLIVMVGDNDAGGVATYAQAGQNYGTSLLWTLLVLIPVVIVNQEMGVRLGAVTGVGYARLLRERFGTFWATFSVGGLFFVNFLTIVTEFIGVALGAAYFGVSPFIAVPIAGVLLVAITVTGRFETWERFMFLFIVTNLLIFPMVIFSGVPWGSSLHDTVVPGINGGITPNAVLLIIAIVGTTVAPWQLFFQQSNVIDKRITPRWIAYERTDTVIGAFVVVIGAGAIMITAAVAFQSTPAAGHYTDALGIATGLAHHVGNVPAALFSVVLIDASIIGASAVTLATSYAFGDMFHVRHSLHRSWREAKGFYAMYATVIACAAGLVLIPGAPLGLFTTAVQALCGLLLPSATTFLLLLCNDREVLGPWVNRPWLNALASAIIGVLIVLSLVLVVTTVFPAIDVTMLIAALGALLVVVLLASGAVALRRGRLRAPLQREDRESWRMPPATLLTRPVWSRARRVGISTLGGYVLLAMVMLLVKAVQLATGH